MTWGTSYKQPPGWRATVRRILARDDHRCYLCGGDAITADHIINVAAGGGHSDDNLAAICGPCHQAKTQAEARRGRARVSRKRATEKHPGRR